MIYYETVYLKRYRLPSSVARDTVINNCVPLGHVLDCIVLFNSTANAVTLSVDINGESVPYVDVPANGYYIVTPNDRYFATQNAYISLTSTDWNNSQIGLQTLFWKAT